MGNTLRNLAIAGGLLAGAATLNSSLPEGYTGPKADTYGPGSMLATEAGCDPTTTVVVLDENGDRKAYAVDDLSVRNNVFNSPEQNIEDELLVTAVGRVGTSDITEVVFANGRNHDGVIEVVDGLPFDETLEAGNEYRVDVEDLRDGEAGHRDLTFEVREGVRKATLTVEPASQNPTDGVELTLVQDCGTYAPVAN